VVFAIRRLPPPASPYMREGRFRCSVRQEDGAPQTRSGRGSTHGPRNAPAGRLHVVRGVAGGARSGQCEGVQRDANRRWARRRFPLIPSARLTHGQAALPGTLSGSSHATRRPLPAGCLPPTKSKRTPALRVTSSVSVDPVGLADQRHLLCPWWRRLPLAQRLRGRRKQPDRTVSLTAADAGVHRGAAITQRPPQAAGAAVREPDLLGHRPRSSAPRRPQYLAGIPPPMGPHPIPG
jgi:hypothetical protein